MSALIQVIFDEKKQQFICHQEVTIGRDHANTISVKDPRLSRNHAKIAWDEKSGKYLLHDCGSRNGCFISGHKIEQPTILKNGEIIVIGDTIITFEELDDMKS